MSEDAKTTDQREDGFEFRGRFYPWRAADTGKDLLLIDRITGMPVDKFFEILEDDEQAVRGSVLLALIATSLRAGNPTWSVERVLRTVMDLSLGSDVEIIGGDSEEKLIPPASGGSGEPQTSGNSADVSSSS